MSSGSMAITLLVSFCSQLASGVCSWVGQISVYPKSKVYSKATVKGVRCKQTGEKGTIVGSRRRKGKKKGKSRHPRKRARYKTSTPPSRSLAQIEESCQNMYKQSLLQRSTANPCPQTPYMHSRNQTERPERMR
ncbi:hypothetical protein BO78DRAFT_183494 [Aspergillus sclerotiicarbonarius CBS 121057]|uniref:Secreted protein n=1 Tax=Aspergillus sclerotiicarbonarius (strain CBS 121057 / IBT 28362) TaxID=1448318 RepID=A0A319FMN5_ASPSB|nr:hypothetical protein BO78DRAFT_183494 [Aspergillus sclerotiicarbonarius CBS 121057]